MRKGNGALFFLEARVVGRDALASLKGLHLGRFGYHIRVQERSEFPDRSLLTFFALCQGAPLLDGLPTLQRRIVEHLFGRKRRHHQIPADQSERGGMARLHGCDLAEATRNRRAAA